MLVTPTQDTSSEYAATHRLVNFQQSLIPVYKYKFEYFVILLLPKWYKVNFVSDLSLMIQSKSYKM